jgi:nucleolar complex protein 2
MAKQSKRSRKFQASGGVAKRLQHGGTVTKHGKLKNRRPKKKEKEDAKAGPDTAPVLPSASKRRSDDLTSSQNVASLNLDAFFNQVADTLQEAGDDDDDSAQGSDANDANDANKAEGSRESDGDRDSDDEDDNEERTTKKTTSSNSGNAKNAKKRKSVNEDSSSDEDDDDGDIEEAEARMKEEMAKLTEKDPEFYEFLQENETSLLEFGQEDDVEEEDIDEDMDEAADQKSTGKETSISSSSNGIVLTLAVLDKLRRGTFASKGVKALKRLVAAYRSGCHLADAVAAGPGESGQAYVIESSKVFDALMVLCLSRCHEAFRYHLLGEEVGGDDKGQDKEDEINDKADRDNQPIQPHKLENAAKWEVVKPTLLSFLRSTIHLLTESKEPGLLAFVLKALAKYLPLATPFPRVAEALLKTLIGLWSAPLDSSEDFQVVRLQAFFRIRQLAVTQPFPFIETCLKKCYLAYAQRAAFGTASSLATTLPTLTFMGNCLVELYSLDFHSSYQHAFIYIRQLALYLRAALQKKTPESFQQVFGWQYMHCLKLWVAIMAQAVTKEDEEPDAKVMRSLLYPLSEIIIGTARTAPSPVRLFPLRLQCIRLLQQLAAAAQVFLPTTSLLLDCLDWKEWYAKPKKATKRSTLRGGLPMYMLLKLPKDDPLRTHEQLEAAVSQIFILLEREMELYRYTASFPEFRVRIRQRCLDFSRTARSPRWKAYAKACIDKSDQYADLCTLQRSKLSQAPKDISQLECLRPSHEPTMRARHQSAMDQEAKAAQNTLAAATAASLASSTAKKEEDDEVGSEDYDEEMKKDEPKAEKTRKSKKLKKKDTAAEADDGSLNQEDEVVEGVDWLDE